MANATIGAMKVILGLDSAQFQKGLAQSQAGLARFAGIATRTLAAVGAAATVAAGALAVAVKHSIDHADALNKAAQQAGVTVQALSRLEYAAKLSDVSLESLTGGLQKLSRTMVEVASGKGPLTAFQALGISVTDAAGKLRNSDAVFADIADRFSKMENGALKTNLAIQIFGKSGAQLIPLLNSGADGLKRYADESDRLGMTISDKTAQAAEQFNDTLTIISATMQGMVNKVMEAALPALQAFANTLASPEFQQAAAQLATWIIEAMNAIVQAVTIATNTVTRFGNEIRTWSAVAANISTGNFAGAMAAYQAGELGKTAQGFGSSFRGGWGSRPAPAEITVRGGNKAPTAPLFEMPELSAFTSGGGGKKSVADGIKAAGSALDSVQPKADKFASSFESAGSALAGLIKGTSTIGDVLLQVASSLIGTMDFGGLGGAGSLLKGLLGGLGGFKDGGSGRIGGYGPPDSKLFMAKVSPGEAFAFGADAEGGRGRAITIQQSFALDGAVDIKTAAAIAQRMSSQAVETVKRSLPEWQVNLQQTGQA